MGVAPEPDTAHLFTEARWREHHRGLGLAEEPLPCPWATGEPVSVREGKGAPSDALPKSMVWAVAMDVRGHIATVTSTGGRTNKVAGRVGDTPSMGAGFWAEEWSQGERGTVAIGVSGTGDGDVSVFSSVSLRSAAHGKHAVVFHLVSDGVDDRAPHAVLG